MCGAVHDDRLCAPLPFLGHRAPFRTSGGAHGGEDPDGRVTVVFGLSFIDATDQECARIFLQDSREVQRRKVPQGPPVFYSPEKPLDLDPVDNVKKADMFLSISLMERHVKNPLKAAVDTLNFRNYLQYHLKCSKSFFHERMRRKTRVFLKVLNRAKVKHEQAKLKGVTIHQ